MPLHPTCLNTGYPSAGGSLEEKAVPEVEVHIDASSRLRLLVVDDEASLRRCVAQMIRSAGHEVEEAASSAEGVRRLNGAPLDAVLTDLRMPGGSGWDVVRAAHALHPGLPVLVMTGCSDALEEGGGAEALAAGVLLKPFRMEDLLGRIAALERSSPRQEG